MANIAPKKRGPARPKSPPIGRPPPGGGTDIDEVSASRIWKEHCLKVESIIPDPGEFSFNPFTTHYMCQPPTNFWPSIHVSEEELAMYRKFLEQFSMIKQMEKTPPEKYLLPQTVNQEYGWNGTPLVEKNPLFNYDNNSCDITKYAAHYYSLMHTTPFSKKDPIAPLTSGASKTPLPTKTGGGGADKKLAPPVAAAPAPSASPPAGPAPAPAPPPIPPTSSTPAVTGAALPTAPSVMAPT